MRIDTLDKQGYRKFGLVMALIITLLFGLLLPWVFDKQNPSWPWITSAVFVLWALVIPNTLAVIYKPWMSIGHMLGFVNTKIILSLVFFVVFTPVALLFKLIGKDPMNRKVYDTTITSYWKTSHKEVKNRMEKVY